ncbi:MAG: arsenate reductase (glutaredoxin) [Bacteroidetes bacterium]|nr:arsenate reductase (glutaredoxin) [Bacteroidota bacterium]
MKYIIYHNPRCSKSRESLCYLQEQGAEIEIKEYLKDSPDEKELKELLKMLKIPAIDLIRKGEKLFKEKFADKKYSDEQWIKVMAENPILIERPIVIKGNQAVIGRPVQKVVDLG